ncbi:helix-turn-helix domain-containing protein [Streptomyces griseoluteus]|uniref:helix-turn-helix domain-containing protein n=1 Tax=Streptomyces griseoluteus TaxID=29306 RepID=UPI00382A065C
MTEQQRGRRAIEVGPTGQTVAANIARLRERRALTTRQLSGELERAGRSIPASGITRMEKGERVVTADELVALAVIFGVSPSALLLPLKDAPTDVVEVTGAGEVSAEDAWDWADGLRPLSFSEGDEDTQMLEYDLYSRPSRRRRARHAPKFLTREAGQLLQELAKEGRSGLVVDPRLLQEDERKRQEQGGGSDG